MATIKYKKSRVESGVKVPKNLQKFTGYPVLSQPVNTPTIEEQDQLITDMLRAQSNMLSKRDKNVRRGIERAEAKLAAKQRNREVDEAAAAEMVTYHHKVPAPTRQQSVPGTTVTAAPDTRSTGSTVTRTVEQRTGQGDFRNRVSMNFGGSCAITGHNVTQCLQAAHISPFASDKNNNTSNGIFMSADLHLLFDNHLISIDPDTLKVHFKCKHPLAEVYEGAVLGGHRVKLDMDALRIHWNLFKG